MVLFTLAMSGLACSVAWAGAAPAAARDAMPGAGPSTPAAWFARAATEYDAGHIGDAIESYRHILGEGFGSTELLFNLGNAYYRQQDLGRAVLCYRRAHYLSPRDPDIRANLRFALQSKGAIYPEAGRISNLLGRFALAEWAVTAWLAYGALAVMLGLYLLWRAARPVLLRLAAACALLLVLSGIGLGQWIALFARPEVVVLNGDQKALFAPLEGSTAHFALPVGAIARTEEVSGAWVKVSYNKQSGWIQASACLPVCTWPDFRKGHWMGRLDKPDASPPR